MKNALIFIITLALAPFAFAADVVATIGVVHQGKLIFQQQTTYVGMTDAEAKAMQRSGQKILDFASQHQDKGGPYTITWKWNADPQVETAGMRFSAVNATLRKGVRWLDSHVADAEVKDKAGKKKPWGNP
jgi:hypothetical protein